MRDIEEIKRGCQATTQGKWVASGQVIRIEEPDGTPAPAIAVGFLRNEDARFAAHARQDVPNLIAEVQLLSRALQALDAEVTRLHSLFESLTPGGSEYHDDPNRCANWIRARLSTVVEQVRARQDAEQETARLRDLLREADEDRLELRGRLETSRDANGILRKQVNTAHATLQSTYLLAEDEDGEPTDEWYAADRGTDLRGREIDDG